MTVLQFPNAQPSDDPDLTHPRGVYAPNAKKLNWDRIYVVTSKNEMILEINVRSDLLTEDNELELRRFCEDYLDEWDPISPKRFQEASE